MALTITVSNEISGSPQRLAALKPQAKVPLSKKAKHSLHEAKMLIKAIHPTIG